MPFVFRVSLSPIVLVLALAGCATTSHEPPNLQPLKQQIRSYADSGQYERDIAAVAAEARAWIETRAARRTAGERLAVVFDLDETLFLNWPQIRQQDFGYVPAVWDAWVEAAKAPAIEPVREVYRAARRLNVDVIYITGRPEAQRAATERNLGAIDCAEHVELICRPAEVKGATADFKTAARRRLTAAGWIIIANIGDQQSDLAGGFAERTFKLPNSFYLTD